MIKKISNKSTGTAPKVGVVLGSGGIKPLASVALFDFLAAENINIDFLVGCSGGGQVAAAVALGYKTEQIIEFYELFFKMKAFSAIDYRSLLNIANLPFGRFDIEKGVIYPRRLQDFFNHVYQDKTFDDLLIPTVLQATNVQTGKGVLLKKGRLAEAVYATSALYPMAPPIHFQNQWLIDGVFSSPLPLIEAVKHNLDVIIAVVFHEKNNPNPERVFDGFDNIINCFTRSLTRSQISIAIDLHHYDIIMINVSFDLPIAVTDKTRIPEILAAGKLAVELKKDEILASIKNFKPKNESPE